MTGSSLPRAGGVGEVAAVLVERVVLVLGVGVGDPLRAAHRRQGRVDPVGGDPGGAEQAVGLAALAAAQREQEVLGGDVLVLEPRHLVEGGHEHVAERVADGRLAAAELLRARLELALEPRGQRLRGDLEALQQRGHQAVLLAQQGEQQVLGLDPGVLHGGGRLLGGLQGLLGAFGEAIKSHGGVIPQRRRRQIPVIEPGGRRWARDSILTYHAARRDAVRPPPSQHPRGPRRGGDDLRTRARERTRRTGRDRCAPGAATSTAADLPRSAWYGMKLVTAAGARSSPAADAARRPGGARARGGILVDIDSNTILWQQDAHAQLPPASTAKVLTALVALENLDPSRR